MTTDKTCSTPPNQQLLDGESLLHLMGWHRPLECACLDEVCEGWADWRGGRRCYERNRSLVPYVGINWERKLGGTAYLARVAGEGVSAVSAVFRARAMF